MRTNLLAAVAAVALAVVPGTPAAAEPPDVAGEDCNFSFATDPTSGGVTGYVRGGPLVVGYPDGADNPVSAPLVCAFQVDAPTYAGPDVVSVSGSGMTVVAFPPTPISFEAGPDQAIYICVELDVTNARGETQHYYWDYVDTEFSTSDTARCAFAGCYQVGPFGDCPDGPGEEFDNDFFLPLIDAAFGVAEQVACLPLATLFPPDGDVPGVWDCPPYES